MRPNDEGALRLTATTFFYPLLHACEGPAERLRDEIDRLAADASHPTPLALDINREGVTNNYLDAAAGAVIVEVVIDSGWCLWVRGSSVCLRG